jgi:hypothetical protein
VDKQTEAVKAHQDKVAESDATRHGTRLAPRPRALVAVAQEHKDAQHHHAHLTAHASPWGPPRQRADRAFRTQARRTMRTLGLENALRACMVVRLGTL